MTNIVFSSIKYVAIDLIGDILYFPVWWYTKGLKGAALTYQRRIKSGERYFALRVWLLNLFKPMYGQEDWQGRLISFFMRTIVLIFRFFLMVIWVCLVTILFLIYLILPIFVISKIISFLFV
ncbi:MAG: hypothetical protein COY82_00825 [Parcubacteria group bacterium CG_4_10_14_0_8_um_filter_35_7]|nr:MAG: hypothetical protein COY82_00825 [Parcubacteria group bacterium CG_4_10_14_0_8_um_filter_35_7]